MVEAFAYGGGSILNAIATWKGAAFAINLKVRAFVEGSDKNFFPNELARAVYQEVSQYCKLGNVKIRTTSEIPSGGGLKSSSAAANAMTLALLKYCGISPSPYFVLKLSVDASKKARVTVTGALDDASASLLGGLTVTDNKNMVILRRSVLQDVKVIILPKGGRSMGFEEIAKRLRTFKREFERVFDVLESDPFEAMTLNGVLVASALGYSSEPLRLALRAGALGATVSGNGPSYVALAEPERAEKVANAWSQYGIAVVTDVINTPAHIPN